MIMTLHSLPVYASNNSLEGAARGTYMSSARVYAKISGEDDVIGRAVVVCLSEVAEIDVVMYLQRAYGNSWNNASQPFYMSVEDASELDESAIIYNISPGTYRIFIDVTVRGHDGYTDLAAVGTGSFTINT